MKITNVKINSETKQIELTTIIPFQDNREHFISVDPSDILQCYRKQLIVALQGRVDNCLKDLMNNLSNIKYSDVCGIIVYPNGHFSTPTFELMKNTIKALEEKDYSFVLYNKAVIAQIVKALWEAPQFDENTKFSKKQLMDMLMEMMLCL